MVEMERETARARQIFVVLNRKSGQASVDDVRAALEAQVGDGRAVELFELQGSGETEAADAVGEALRRGCDLVVAVGGDGTVAAVAHALVGTDVPLAVIPMGTANVFARELGIPLALADAAALVGGEFATSSVDVMRVNGRHYVLQIGIGVDAVMIRDTPTEAKSRFGRLAYLWTAARALSGFQPERFNIVVDGKRHRLNASEVLIANGGVLGIDPLRWGPDIRPDDGAIDLCVVNASAPSDYLGVLWTAVTGRHQSDRRLRYFRAERHISVNARRPLPIQADGEVIGRTPLQVEVVPGALRVAVPVVSVAAAPLPSEEQIDPAVRAEMAPVEAALKAKLREIRTPEQAEAVADELLVATSAGTEEEVRERAGPAGRPADAVVEQAAEPGAAPAGEALVEAAEQMARTSGERREALEHAVVRATNPEEYAAPAPELAGPLGLLRAAVLRRMRPWQAVDARLFLAINHLPHTRLSNRLMYGLTTVMNTGAGWLIGLAVAALLDRPRGWRALRNVAPPLWIATAIVEFPIKYYFRRRRPFIDVVKAISIGKKPGSYSFPSGHSAAAFGGAWLITRHYPRLAPLWYAIAAAVGFSRVYLGAHYPGDVLSGAAAGSLLAELARRALARLGRRRAG